MSPQSDKLHGDQSPSLPEMDYATVTTNREAARMFVYYLMQAAHTMAEEHEWTPEDLFELLSFAYGNDPSPVTLLEGRAFRRRLEEALERADRYDENFSVMVVDMGEGDRAPDFYGAVIDGLVERLRRSDQVFLFANRAAILLPYTEGKDLSNLIARIRQLVGAVLGPDAAITIQQIAYPSDLSSTEEMLAWVEKHLPVKG